MFCFSLCFAFLLLRIRNKSLYRAIPFWDLFVRHLNLFSAETFHRTSSIKMLLSRVLARCSIGRKTFSSSRMNSSVERWVSSRAEIVTSDRSSSCFWHSHYGISRGWWCRLVEGYAILKIFSHNHSNGTATELFPSLVDRVKFIQRSARIEIYFLGNSRDPNHFRSHRFNLLIWRFRIARRTDVVDCGCCTKSDLAELDAE